MKGPFVLLAVVCVLAGCSALPGDGPSANDVLSQSKVSDSPASPSRYEIVDIDSPTVAILRTRLPASFSARFGDYRPSADLRIGIGDVVSVTIYEAGANGLFSAPLQTDRFSTGSKSATIPDQQVNRDGSISVPYAGRILVNGKTPLAVQGAIERALEGKAIQPQVLVGVTKPISNTVTVTGEVAGGARVPLTPRGDRILDAVANAGGVKAPVNETVVRLSRGGTTLSVPLSRVVADPREDVYLRPGDVLTLVRDPESFLAYGASGRNEKIPFEADSISLAEAMAKMGGIEDLRADPSGVFVFRFEPPPIARELRPNSSLLSTGWVPVVYRLNMRDPASLFLSQSFPIFNKDVIYVSNAPVTELQKALLVFNLIASPISTGISVSSVATR